MKIILSKAADKFLQANAHLLEDRVLTSLLTAAYRKVAQQENNNSNVKELKGNLRGYYRIRQGKLRIIFTIEKSGKIELISVHKIGFRKDIYQ